MKSIAFWPSLTATLFAASVNAQPAQGVPPLSSLPDCLTSLYDAQRHLFTLKNPAPNQPNQQCLLTVAARGRTASPTVIPAGRYLINLSDGGDGGAGGTLQSTNGGGGGGGGGAGAREMERMVDLTEGVYKVTIGAGGPGGNPCIPTPSVVFSGGPGWLGSPSSLVRVDTGEVTIGTPGADRYARPTKRENEKRAGNPDGHGGSGPGKTTGGDGGRIDVTGFRAEAPEAGQGRAGNSGGTPGISVTDKRSVGSGGGGGASTKSEGGDGGGELVRHWVQPPERGALGSGGGGGEGTLYVCGAGGSGGHGFMALRAYLPKSADASDQGIGLAPSRVIR